MVELYRPHMEDLWFRETMLSDGQTMFYNHAYGGTIPFPKEQWARWYDAWIINPDNKRFYRYVKKMMLFWEKQHIILRKKEKCSSQM